VKKRRKKAGDSGMSDSDENISKLVNVTEVIKALKKLKRHIPDDTICYVMGTLKGKPIAVPLYNILVMVDEKGMPMMTFHNERVYNMVKEEKRKNKGGIG
jgi:hypothetical protein